MAIVSSHILIFFMLWGSGNNLTNYSENIPAYSKEDRIEIEGIVVDATQTKIGRDFYDLFYQIWNPPATLPKLTITISETPLPSLGTRVTVKVQDNIVFQRFLQARYDVIEQNAEYAVDRATRYLQVYEQLQRDLKGDDLMGTGIY